MTTTEEKRKANDLKVAEHVREFGCHLISVFDPEEKSPSFTYSVGIRDSAGAPDAIVFGVSPRLGASMVNEYNRRVRDGFRFERGVLYEGFLDGFSIYVEPARRALLGNYTLGCERYYGSDDFDVVQLVYPSTQGEWPWQADAPDWFKHDQPMLGRPRLDEPSA